MGFKNGVEITSAANNGTMIQSGYENGTQIFGAGGALEPFTFDDAGIEFTINNLGIVSLTIALGTIASADYDDGHDFKPVTNETPRVNNIVVNVPGGYSNTGTVNGTKRFIQPAVSLPTVTLEDIAAGTLFTNSYRVDLEGEITDDGGLDVSTAGFYVYQGTTTNPNTVLSEGTEITQSDVLGEFTQTYSTTLSNTVFSVIAYATNVIGIGVSSVKQYTSGTIVAPYTQTTWTASGGYVTVASDGDVTVVLGNAVSSDFPDNVGTHDTCGAESVTVTGTVEVPATGYSNPGADVSISTSVSRNSTKTEYDFDVYNGVVKVTQGGTATATAGNAASATVNSQTPSGENTGTSNRDVVVNITVTTSSTYCNVGDTFTGNKTVTQSGIPPVVTTLNISPNEVSFSSDAQSTLDPQPTWTQTGGDSTAGLTLTTNPVPSWISSTNEVANPLTGTPNEITISVLKNETDQDRSTILTWETDDGFASDSITVTQLAPTNNDATSGSINDGDDITVTFNTTTIDLAILSNGDWTIAEGTERGTNVAGWTLARLSGSGNGSVTFNGNNNTSGMDRTGQITLTSTSGTELDSITFTQGYEGDTN